MESITSTSNSKIKSFIKLKTRKGRQKSFQYILEGVHAVEEALINNVIYDYLIIVEDHQLDPSILDNVDDDKILCITKSIAKQLSETVHSQGVFLIAQMDEGMSDIPDRIDGKWLLLDNIQDPGNVGTMVRTADAAGFEGVFFGSGSSDWYNSKILRSMQGSNYHLSLKCGNLENFISILQDNNYLIYGTFLDDDAFDYRKLDRVDKYALVMGNEGQGIRPSISNLINQKITIEMPGNSESLNVAIAAGILMFSL